MTGYDTGFERELKGILQGDEKTISAAIKSCTPLERESYLKIIQHPFMVVRAAGSLGVDLVAIRHDFSFPIEVKTSAERVIRFSRSEHLQEQLASMTEECRRAGVLPIYAYRLRDRSATDKWRVFAIPTGNLSGRAELLYERIPKPDVTPEGNMVLRWDSGMPLSKFIEYLCL